MRSFMMGYSFATLVILAGLGYKGYGIFKQIQPAFAGKDLTISQTEQNRKDILAGMEQLIYIAELVEHDQLRVMAYTNSANVAVTIEQKREQLKTRSYMQEAIFSAKDLAEKTGNYELLVQTRANYGVYLHNKGNSKAANRFLQETLKLAKSKAPDSPWTGNVENLLRSTASTPINN